MFTDDKSEQTVSNAVRSQIVFHFDLYWIVCLFVCVDVLRPRRPNGVMSSAVSLPNHTFTGQA